MVKIEKNLKITSREFFTVKFESYNLKRKTKLTIVADESKYCLILFDFIVYLYATFHLLVCIPFQA